MPSYLIAARGASDAIIIWLVCTFNRKNIRSCEFVKYRFRPSLKRKSKKKKTSKRKTARLALSTVPLRILDGQDLSKVDSEDNFIF